MKIWGLPWNPVKPCLICKETLENLFEILAVVVLGLIILVRSPRLRMMNLEPTNRCHPWQQPMNLRISLWILATLDSIYHVQHDASYVRYDSFICATWRIRVCKCSTACIHMCRWFIHKCVTWFIHMCDMTRSYVCNVHIWMSDVKQIQRSHVAHMNQSHCTWMSHVTYMNESSCNIWMHHVAYLNEQVSGVEVTAGMARNIGLRDIQISNPHYDRSSFTGQRESYPRHGTKGHSYDDSFISLGYWSTYRIR